MGKWPDHSDAPVDRARAVAYSYRQALLESAPQRCAVLDAVARELGEGWIAPLPTDPQPGDRVSTEQAARLLGVTESTVRSWGSREFVPITRYVDGWDVGELMMYRASQRRRRGHR